MRDLVIVFAAMVLIVLSSAWWKSADPTDRRKWVMPAWTGPDSPQTPVPVDDPGDDAQDWADELHAINLATHRDRPVHQLTHYEVEAVIRELGVPEWVPERWRVAA